MWSDMAPPAEHIGPPDCPVPVIAEAIHKHSMLWLAFRQAINDVQQCEQDVRDAKQTDLRDAADALLNDQTIPKPQTPAEQGRLLEAKQRRAATREALNRSAAHIEQLVFDHQGELGDWAREQLNTARADAVEAATRFAGAVPAVARAEAVMRWVQSPTRFSVATPTVRRGNDQQTIDAAIVELVDRLAPAPPSGGS